MSALLVFAATLAVAVFISDVARRTVVSTSLLFLVSGFAFGAMGLVGVGAGDAAVQLVARIALFVVLFTDGMRLGAGGLVGVWRWAFVAVTVLLARPAGLLLASIGTNLDRREWIAAAWFGPKGFSSVLYALLILHSAIPKASYLYHLAALTIGASMVAVSSTDVIGARMFTGRRRAGAAT